MMRIGGPIPITIYATFWLFAALIGYANTQNLVGAILWMLVLFISVLFHELGHALTALFFKQRPTIELIALGGVTYHEGAKLPFGKQFFIIFNGPLFGFLLFGAAALLLRIPSLAQGPFAPILFLTQMVNLFWTIVNLLPVLPLDGGQLLRVVLEKIFGMRGLRYALFTGIVIAFVICLLSFLYQQLFIGAFFFLFAFQNYMTLRRLRHLSASDCDDSVKDLIGSVEDLLKEGKKEEAAALCEDIRTRAKKGIFYTLATQYLAFLEYDKGHVQKSYELLLPLKKELENDALFLLHKMAFEQRDFPLVVELGSVCFQAFPTAEIALRNALAHAELNQSIPAVGWLRTAVEEGLANVQEVIKTHAFDPIRQDPSFEQFLKSLPLK